ncbi:MAG TPA: hemolysin family protein [Gemmatimonadaceae bacterium]|nr:hemolysin family protein [Gemmatimonadaceae bacterium]
MDLHLVAIAALIALNAFFVSAEFALVRVRRPRIEAMAREGDTMASLVVRALGVRRHVLSACQLGITLSSLGLGWLLAQWLGTLTPPDGTLGMVMRVALAIAIVVYLHIVFGELCPKAVALARPERVARLLAAPLLGFSWLVRPITYLVSASARLVSRWLDIELSPEEATAHSPEELRLLVERSERSGALEQQEAELLEGVFEFTEKNAREVMTPRTEIIALPAAATLGDTLAVIEEHGFTRYPVYDGSIDNILGIVLAKDLLPLLHGGTPDFSLGAIVRPVHFIPGTREVEEVLSDFKRLKEHMAIVLDEYGGTAGVVTMEDLLEEIVGEILDEYDEVEPTPPRGARSGEILVAGETNIGELNERLGLSVPEGDYTTIGGYVFGSLGRVPRVGDSVTVGGASFTVRALEGRRVAEIAVRAVPLET